MTRRERARVEAELAAAIVERAEIERAFDSAVEALGSNWKEAGMCKVLNVKQVGKRPAADRVYVGRPSKWGNPFVIGRDGTRDDVIEKYRAWMVRQPALMAALGELRGKHLVCWCAPERCHAEVLIELANS
jgi:hypothetical protein